MADKIDIFTVAMRNEFVTGFNAIAAPAPIDSAIYRVSSTGRIENYAYLSPVPGISQFQGYRRYGAISSVKYKLENLEYDAAFEVLLRDIEDEQTGGYNLKARDLGQKAKLFYNRSCLKTLAAGKSTPCFDGSNFFAASHTIGVGGNILTGTAAATDGKTHNIVALITAGMIKPLIWQDRKAPDLMNDSGTPYSKLQKTVKFWVDFEGISGFGYFWDAILVQYSNTPVLAEIQNDFGKIEAQYRTFQIPQNLATDPIEYVHEQIQFSKDNLLIVCSPGIAHLVRQSLTLSLISNTENPWVGFAQYSASNYLNTVT